MKRLARKVTIAKWKGADWATVDRIPSDALSIDLRTTGNTLSFWRADAEGKGEDAAILAVLGALQHVEKIDIAFVNEDSIQGLDMLSTPGNTLFEDLRELHVDVANLDQNSLFKTAQALGVEIFGETTKRITRQEVKSRLQVAVNEGRISWDDLPEGVQKAIERPTA